MYYITSSSNNHKNQLQKAVYDALSEINTMTVADPEKLLVKVIETVSLLNSQHPRCSSAQVSDYLSRHYGQDKSISIHCGDWAYRLSLLPIKGELEL